jgi:hypothetical protein
MEHNKSQNSLESLGQSHLDGKNFKLGIVICRIPEKGLQIRNLEVDSFHTKLVLEKSCFQKTLELHFSESDIFEMFS